MRSLILCHLVVIPLPVTLVDIRPGDRNCVPKIDDTEEVQSLRADHNFAPDTAIQAVAIALRKNIDEVRFDKVYNLLFTRKVWNPLLISFLGYFAVLTASLALRQLICRSSPTITTTQQKYTALASSYWEQ